MHRIGHRMYLFSAGKSSIIRMTGHDIQRRVCSCIIFKVQAVVTCTGCLGEAICTLFWWDLLNSDGVFQFMCDPSFVSFNKFGFYSKKNIRKSTSGNIWDETSSLAGILTTKVCV